MNELYRQHTQDCFDAACGVDKNIYDSAFTKLSSLLHNLQKKSCKATSAVTKLSLKTDDITDIELLAAEISLRFEHVVVIGSGGSGLSGRMLAQMTLPASKPQMHFLENIDPDAMDILLNAIEVKSTCFIIVSKSGETVETLSQFYGLIHYVKTSVPTQPVGEQFIVITMVKDNPLRRVAGEHGIKILDHPADIGGRFSALTAVGLLPAALCGLDIRALRTGAASVVREMETMKDADNFAPAQGAALQYATIKSGRNISVMLPYSARLSGFSDWYRQSWAESLGKGGKGSTPIRAVGSTDQHSQLQLYLDGPKDKFFTLITLDRKASGLAIHAPKDLPYLQGKTLGDVMEAEQKATLATLKRNHCPVRLITLEKLDEKVMGALLMHFTLEIFCMAHLLEVNPFDQPAVEEGKILARDYLLGKTA